MERFFTSRPRAIALIVNARKSLLATAEERLSSDARRLQEAAAELERLMLDVRAGRVDVFELTQPAHIHVTVISG